MIHTDDVSAWTTTLDVCIFLVILGLFVWTVFKLVNNENTKRSTMILVSAAFSLILLVHLLNAFVFFDSGRIPDVPPVEEDGHAKIVQKAPDLTPEDQLTATQEAKKSQYLKAQDQGPEEARKESEAYLQKILERNQ